MSPDRSCCLPLRTPAISCVPASRVSPARPGQALRGSSELHAWADSNLYLRRRDRQILMTVEHRAAPGLNDIEIELADDGKGPALRLRQLETAGAAPEPETVEPRILKILAQAETPLSQFHIRKRAALRNATVTAALHELVREGRIERLAGGRYRSVAAVANRTAPPAAADNGKDKQDAVPIAVPGSNPWALKGTGTTAPRLPRHHRQRRLSTPSRRGFGQWPKACLTAMAAPRRMDGNGSPEGPQQSGGAAKRLDALPASRHPQHPIIDRGIASGSPRSGKDEITLEIHATSPGNKPGNPSSTNVRNNNVTADRPNQLWVADITYVAIAVGFVYAAVILDAWSRRVVGYAISRSIDTRLTLAALKAAVRSRQPPRACIHHSDSEYLRAGSLGVT